MDYLLKSKISNQNIRTYNMIKKQIKNKNQRFKYQKRINLR